jgi:hypothetical protein
MIINITGFWSVFVKRSSDIVLCRAICTASQAKIFGSNVSHGSSSICLAGIHHGTITKEGGQIVVSVSTWREQYLGDEKNGINQKI